MSLQLSVWLKKKKRDFGIAVLCSFCCLSVVSNQSAVEVGDEQCCDAAVHFCAGSCCCAPCEVSAEMAVFLATACWCVG